MSEQLCGNDSFLFACVQYVFDQNKHNYACAEVIFNQETKVVWSDMPTSILRIFCFSEGLDWWIILKKRKKGHWERRVKQLLFLCYHHFFICYHCFQQVNAILEGYGGRYFAKFCGAEFFSHICWGINLCGVGVELKLFGGVVFVYTSLFHLFRNSQYPQKQSVSFKNFFRKYECIRRY